MSVPLPRHSRVVLQESLGLSEPQGSRLGDGSGHDASGSCDEGGEVHTGSMAGVSSTPISLPSHSY